MVMHHEVRQVATARAGIEEPPIHFLVFTGKQPRVARGSQVLSVWTHAHQHIAANDGVASLEDAGKVSAEVALFAAAVDRTDHCEVLLGQPGWGRARPAWAIGTTGEL